MRNNATINGKQITNRDVNDLAKRHALALYAGKDNLALDQRSRDQLSKIPPAESAAAYRAAQSIITKGSNDERSIANVRGRNAGQKQQTAPAEDLEAPLPSL